MRARIGDAGLADVEHDGNRGAAQHQDGRDQDRDRRHLHFVTLDFFAQIFRRASDHQAGNEDGQDGEHQHAVQAGANAAKDDFTELHQQHRHRAAQRRERIVHGVDRAARRRSGNGREQGRRRDAKAGLLAFHVAASLKRAGGLVNPQRRQVRVGDLLGPHHHQGCRDEDQAHGRQYGNSLPQITHHPAESEAQTGGNQENSEHLHEVGQRGRVLVRVRRICIEKAATVGTDHLDRFLRRDRTHGNRLGRCDDALHQRLALGILERLAIGAGFRHRIGDRIDQLDFLVSGEILDHALPHQEHGKQQRQRQKYIQR